jgi:hypothetical protein
MTFTNGLTATTYHSIQTNILGQKTGETLLLFFDNWEEHVPASGTYTITPTSGRIAFAAPGYNRKAIGGVEASKSSAFLYQYYANSDNYPYNTNVKMVAYSSLSQTITANHTQLLPNLMGIEGETTGSGAHKLYISSSSDEQTTTFYFYTSDIASTKTFGTSSEILAEYYITSELAGRKKQWVIPTNLIQGTDPSPGEDGNFILHQLNQPPFYTGSYINYRLEIPESIYDVVERIEFTTTKGGEIYDTRNYDRNGETFQVGYAGAYTIDEITHQYTPDTPNTYSEMVSVFDEDYHLIFTTSKTNTISQSVTTSTLRIEVESEYDGSKLFDVTGVISWGGTEKFNGTVLQGIYETQIPKNTVITATFSKTGYIERTGSITADSDYTRWIFPLTPSSISIDPSECLVELTATDGIHPLPNVRILFDGNVKYTGQTGKASWITNDIGTKTYSATKTGYQGYNGVLTTIANTTVSQTFVLTPIGGIITPTITPAPTVTPGGNITPPAIGEEGWGIIEAIRWLAGTFLGVHEESLVDAILAMCLIVTCALVIVQYTRDAGGALVGGVIGFFIALLIGWIPIWIIFVMLALGGFVAFLMLSRGG